MLTPGEPPRQGFSQIDRNLFPGHDPASKLILINLSTHDPEFIPTFRHIANQTGLSRETVKRRLRKLEELGEIWRIGAGPNRTIKWGLNNTSVGSGRPHSPPKWGQGDPTKECIKGEPDSSVRGLLKNQEKIPPSLPDCDSEIRHPRNDAQNVFRARAVQEYFKGYVSYPVLNQWILDLTTSHGVGAYRDVCLYLDQIRRKSGRPDMKWPFNDRNKRLLTEQVPFSKTKSHLRMVK